MHHEDRLYKSFYVKVCDLTDWVGPIKNPFNHQLKELACLIQSTVQYHLENRESIGQARFPVPHYW